MASRNRDVEFQKELSNIGDVELDDDGKPKRTGTMWSASVMIVAGVIGSGVLSLAWGLAQLGWFGGVSTLLLFSAITLYASHLLADCYRSPHPITGSRNYTYMHAVKSILGGSKYVACGLIQYINLAGLAVGYTITASVSMVAIRKSNCFHTRGRGAPCKFSNNPYMIGLGIIEIFLSQIPSFHKLSWISTLAVVMSFGYSLIGIGLAIAKIISGPAGVTSWKGPEVGPDLSEADKIWRVFQAIGDIAFACSYSIILFEVQDTLSSSQPENKVMKKANTIGIITSTTFYLLCGCLGYVAFGNNAPGNMISGFGFYEPFWLVDVANLFIVVHLVAAYQILVQPVFNVVESLARKQLPTSKFVNAEYPVNFLTTGKSWSINMMRVTWRSCFVVLVTVLSMAFPFFNNVLALLGSISFWPLTVCVPIAMHIARTDIERLSKKWLGLQFLNLVCFLVALAAAIGAIQGLSQGLATFKPFQFKV